MAVEELGHEGILIEAIEVIGLLRDLGDSFAGGFLKGLGGAAVAAAEILVARRVIVGAAQKLAAGELVPGNPKVYSGSLPRPLHRMKAHALREKIAGHLRKVDFHRFPLHVEEVCAGNDNANLLSLIEIGALCPVADHGGCLRAARGGDAVGDGLHAAAVGELQIEAQALEPGRVGSILADVEAQVGGVDLHLRQGEALAIQLHRPVQRHDFPLRRIPGIEVQRKVQLRPDLRLFPLRVGLHRLRPLALPHVPDKQRQLQILRDVLLHKVHGDLPQVVLLLRNTAAHDGGRQMLAGFVAQLRRCVEGGAVLRRQGVEDIHLLLIDDQILHPRGDAIPALLLPHHLDIVVLDCKAQRGIEGQKPGQLAEKGQLLTGRRDRRGEVDQPHKAQKDCGKARGTAPKRRAAPHPPPRSAHGVRVRDRLKLRQQRLIFFHSVHTVSSSRSNFSSCRALRWRVATVPWGISSACAVSAWVMPEKKRKITTSRSSFGSRRMASCRGRLS